MLMRDVVASWHRRRWFPYFDESGHVLQSGGSIPSDPRAYGKGSDNVINFRRGGQQDRRPMLPLEIEYRPLA